MPRFQYIDCICLSLDAGELEPIHDHFYSDAEFLPDFHHKMPSFSHDQGTIMSNQHTCAKSARVASLVRARARSPTPISRARSRYPSGARRSPSPERRIAHEAYGTHGGALANADSDSELYADSDGEFKQLTSSLMLAIDADVDEMEKWELPPRK